MWDNIQYIEESWHEPDATMSGFTKPGWYFWDETQAYCHGPYETREEAEASIKEYCEKVLG